MIGLFEPRKIRETNMTTIEWMNVLGWLSTVMESNNGERLLTKMGEWIAELGNWQPWLAPAWFVENLT